MQEKTYKDLVTLELFLLEYLLCISIVLWKSNYFIMLFYFIIYFYFISGTSYCSQINRPDNLLSKLCFLLYLGSL